MDDYAYLGLQYSGFKLVFEAFHKISSYPEYLDRKISVDPAEIALEGVF